MRFYSSSRWFFILAGFFLMTRFVFAGTEESLDSIVATVNEGVVTQSELNDAMRLATEDLQARHQSVPSPKQLRKQVLNQLIDREILLQLAHTAHLSVSDDELHKVVQHIAEQNHVSVHDLYQMMLSHGLSKAGYEKKLKEEIVLQKLKEQEVAATITMTPDELRAFMQSTDAKMPAQVQYRLKDFQVALSDEPSSSEAAYAKKQAIKLLNLLKQNKDPSAVLHTETDLGTLSANQLPSAFARALSDVTQPGLVGPIRTGNGFHVIDLMKRTVIKPPSMTMEEAQQKLFEQKFAKALQNWMNLMRSRATIRLTDGG